MRSRRIVIFQHYFDVSGGPHRQQGGGAGERQEGAEYRHPGEADALTQAGGRVRRERFQVRIWSCLVRAIIFVCLGVL